LDLQACRKAHDPAVPDVATVLPVDALQDAVALPVAALPSALHPSVERPSETCASDAFFAHPALTAHAIPEVHLDDPVPVLHLGEAVGKSAALAPAILCVAVHLAPSATVEAADAAAGPCKQDEVPSAEQSCAARADPDVAQSAVPVSVLRVVLRPEAPESQLVVDSGLHPQAQWELLLRARSLAPKA
jgi:hypothetical protein